MNKKYDEKIEINKTKEVKQKKSMADEIKEDINDTTFLEKNILKDNQEYDKKLIEKKIKILEGYTLEEYLKYYLKKEEKKQEEEERRKKEEEERKSKKGRKKNQKMRTKK